MRSLVVGWFLALRQIKRSNPWTTVLIVLIMSLTFLNLVVVGGILVGLPVGATLAYNRQYSGDILLRALPTKDYIEQSDASIRTILAYPEIEGISPRYVGRGIVEAHYQTAIGPKNDPETLSATIAGIDPEREEIVTHIGSRMLEGEMLRAGEEGYVVVGKNLLSEYTVGVGILSDSVMTNVRTGSKIRMTINGNVGEYIVKGVLGSKMTEVSTRIFMSDTELRKLLGRTDRNVSEIAVRMRTPGTGAALQSSLRETELASRARIETSREAQGAGLDDIEKTFTVLSTVIGGIGLVVASITVFIVIFINAVTRRKYIGILKGIGISASAIEISYVIQSAFYAVLGSLIGLLVVYAILAPYFADHPIDFPFADGVLLVPYVGTFIKAGILIVVTLIAGYFPARLIVGKNTLDSILGR